MLKWWEHCYIGEGVKGSASLIGKINGGKAAPGIYLVTLSHNPHNIMEIIPAVVLVQRAAYDFCPMIIAMAKGKDEAIDLAGKIAEVCYRETGSFQIKEYIKNR